MLLLYLWIAEFFKYGEFHVHIKYMIKVTLNHEMLKLLVN